jgi:hypothetical protein
MIIVVYREQSKGLGIITPLIKVILSVRNIPFQERLTSQYFPFVLPKQDGLALEETE